MRAGPWAGDFRIAWRNVVRRPGFTFLVVLTLALGLGVNSAMFALFDGVLLRPLPYRDPDRLAFVWQTLPEHGVFEVDATPFDYRAWHDIRSFAGLALVATDTFTISADEGPERVPGSRVTASLLPLLGLAPQIGRTFDAAEDGDAAAPVVMLGDGLWARRFGRDRAAIGRSLQINGLPHTIIGVMPHFASLPGPLASNSDLILPTRMTPAERDNEISHNYTVIARLADGATPVSASAELDALARRMALERPDTHHGVGVRIVSVADQTVRAIKPTLLLIAAGVGLLLLVACANTATLLVARAASRQRESAVRAALGATNLHLLSSAMAESTVYVGLGAAAGLILGRSTLAALRPLLSEGLPPGVPITLDGRVVLFTTAVAGIVAIVLAFLVLKRQPSGLADALKASARAIGGASATRTRQLLVVAQIACAVTLLIAAGLLFDSFRHLSSVTPGFDADRVLSVRVSLTDSGYALPTRRITFVRALIERLDALSGIEDAAITSMVPFGGARGANGVEIEGRTRRPGETFIVDQRHVTPAYFRTLRIPVLKGRALQPADDEHAQRVVVVNRAMAERYWPGGNPLDQRVRVTAGFNEGVWCRIVGVVENVRHIALSRDPVPEVYYPYAQAPVDAFTIVARTAAEPTAIVPAIRQIMHALDRSLPLYDIRTMRQRIQASFAQTRGTMILLLVTSMLAATLAAIALYGSIWYSVSQRAVEIGIRVALGATRASLCTSVVGRALLLTTPGVAVGLTGALASRPLVAGLLFRTSPADVRTYAGVVALLMVLTIVAAFGPAMRAMRVDPVVALRDE